MYTTHDDTLFAYDYAPTLPAGYRIQSHEDVLSEQGESSSPSKGGTRTGITTAVSEKARALFEGDISLPPMRNDADHLLETLSPTRKDVSEHLHTLEGGASPRRIPSEALVVVSPMDGDDDMHEKCTGPLRRGGRRSGPGGPYGSPEKGRSRTSSFGGRRSSLSKDSTLEASSCLAPPMVGTSMTATTSFKFVDHPSRGEKRELLSKKESKDTAASKNTTTTDEGLHEGACTNGSSSSSSCDEGGGIRVEGGQTEYALLRSQTESKRTNSPLGAGFLGAAHDHGEGRHHGIAEKGRRGTVSTCFDHRRSSPACSPEGGSSSSHRVASSSAPRVARVTEGEHCSAQQSSNSRKNKPVAGAKPSKRERKSRILKKIANALERLTAGTTSGQDLLASSSASNSHSIPPGGTRTPSRNHTPNRGTPNRETTPNRSRSASPGLRRMFRGCAGWSQSPRRDERTGGFSTPDRAGTPGKNVAPPPTESPAFVQEPSSDPQREQRVRGRRSSPSPPPRMDYAEVLRETEKILGFSSSSSSTLNVGGTSSGVDPKRIKKDGQGGFSSCFPCSNRQTPVKARPLENLRRSETTPTLGAVSALGATGTATPTGRARADRSNARAPPEGGHHLSSAASSNATAPSRGRRGPSPADDAGRSGRASSSPAGSALKPRSPAGSALKPRNVREVAGGPYAVSIRAGREQLLKNLDFHDTESVQTPGNKESAAAGEEKDKVSWLLENFGGGERTGVVTPNRPNRPPPPRKTPTAPPPAAPRAAATEPLAFYAESDRVDGLTSSSQALTLTTTSQASSYIQARRGGGSSCCIVPSCRQDSTSEVGGSSPPAPRKKDDDLSSSERGGKNHPGGYSYPQEDIRTPLLSSPIKQPSTVLKTAKEFFETAPEFAVKNGKLLKRDDGRQLHPAEAAFPRERAQAQRATSSTSSTNSVPPKPCDESTALAAATPTSTRPSRAGRRPSSLALLPPTRPPRATSQSRRLTEFNKTKIEAWQRQRELVDESQFQSKVERLSKLK